MQCKHFFLLGNAFLTILPCSNFWVSLLMVDFKKAREMCGESADALMGLLQGSWLQFT